MADRFKNVRIIGGTNIKQFYCRKCRKATNIIAKFEGKTYCDDCLPKEYREKLINVNQNGERI